MGRLENTVCSLLEQGEDLVMATILSHEGSTPRTAGTKMIVRRGGDTIATVGGGLVEGEVIKAAEEVFQARSAQVRAFDLSGTNVESMDLVCGGNLEILVEFVAADGENPRIFKELVAAKRNRKKSLLVADLGREDSPPKQVRRCLVVDNSRACGDLDLPEPLADAIARGAFRERYPVVVNLLERRYLVEPSLLLGTAFLFGAGHVSQQVAPLVKMVDFSTVVIDDRSEFANRERFPGADEVRVISSFERAFEGLDMDEDAFIVILTRGHLHDKTVLREALKTEAHYIGMIGSRRKRDRIFDDLKREGFTDKDLARVHAPIGTEILAETPEEIGISIVGEMIRERVRLHS